MISYRDMTFCPFWRDCAKAVGCARPLTVDVERAAERWWGSKDAPIAQFCSKPNCHSDFDLPESEDLGDAALDDIGSEDQDERKDRADTCKEPA